MVHIDGGCVEVETNLNTEDGFDWCSGDLFGGLENGFGVVKVALYEFDLVGILCEGFGGGRRGIASYCEDGKVGVGFDKTTDG